MRLFWGYGKFTILSFFIILPYRSFSGGFHLKTHMGCIICTTAMYTGTVFLSQYVPLIGEIKYMVVAIIWLFGIIMITKYAPADTENVPIISKKERKNKRNMSYCFLTITLIIALFINNQIISNIMIYGMFIQTLSITRIAYKLTNNQYGHEVYNRSIQSV